MRLATRESGDNKDVAVGQQNAAMLWKHVVASVWLVVHGSYEENAEPVMTHRTVAAHRVKLSVPSAC
jgi:hypothetical protein